MISLEEKLRCQHIFNAGVEFFCLVIMLAAGAYIGLAIQKDESLQVGRLPGLRRNRETGMVCAHQKCRLV